MRCVKCVTRGSLGDLWECDGFQGSIIAYEAYDDDSEAILLKN
jgi:hypothetical protein